MELLATEARAKAWSKWFITPLRLGGCAHARGRRHQGSARCATSSRSSCARAGSSRRFDGLRMAALMYDAVVEHGRAEAPDSLAAAVRSAARSFRDAHRSSTAISSSSRSTTRRSSPSASIATSCGFAISAGRTAKSRATSSSTTRRHSPLRRAPPRPFRALFRRRRSAEIDDLLAAARDRLAAAGSASSRGISSPIPRRASIPQRPPFSMAPCSTTSRFARRSQAIQGPPGLSPGRSSPRLCRPRSGAAAATRQPPRRPGLFLRRSRARSPTFRATSRSRTN